MTCKQLAAYKVLLVGCGAPTSGVVNGLSQRWAKGWLINHWLFLSLFSPALMRIFLSFGPYAFSCLLFVIIPFSSLFLSLFYPYLLFSLPFIISFFSCSFVFPIHGLSLFSFSLFSHLFATTFPFLPPEQATTGHILEGFTAYDKGEAILWDGNVFGAWPP